MIARGTARIELDPKDYAHLLFVLGELPRRVGFKHLRIALSAWGGVVKNVAKGLARVDTGLLKKSISVKPPVIPDASYNPDHHGRPAYVIVGPRRRSGRMLRKSEAGRLIGYGKAQKALVAERKRLKDEGTLAPLQRERTAVRNALAAFSAARYRNPSRYAHLVERRHPFIGPATIAGATEGMAKLKAKLKQGIETEARALAN